MERAGLVPGPGLEMHELKTVAQFGGEGFERTPDLRVLRVVIDHLDNEVGVIEVAQRGQRLAHDLDWLVVAGDLDGHVRLIGGFGAVRDPGPPPEAIADLNPALPAERQPTRLNQAPNGR